MLTYEQKFSDQAKSMQEKVEDFLINTCDSMQVIVTRKGDNVEEENHVENEDDDGGKITSLQLISWSSTKVADFLLANGLERCSQLVKERNLDGKFFKDNCAIVIIPESIEGNEKEELIKKIIHLKKTKFSFVKPR